MIGTSDETKDRVVICPHDTDCGETDEIAKVIGPQIAQRTPERFRGGAFDVRHPDFEHQ
jgi:hypothetical protein